MKGFSFFFRRRTPERQNRKRTSYATVNGRPSGASRGSRVAVAIVASVAIGVLGWAGWNVARHGYDRVLATHPAYRIRELDIRSDGSQITPERVRQWTGLHVGMNLAEPDIAAIRALLIEKVPVIREATVRRLFPGRIEIHISERIPIAALGRSGFLGVDVSGCVFSMAPEREELPRIIGYSVPLTPGMHLTGLLFNAIEAVEAARRPPVANYFQIASVDVRENDWLILRIVEGPEVRLTWEGMKEKPTEQSRVALARKMTSLLRILEDARLKKRKLKSVDLTYSDDYIPVE